MKILDEVKNASDILNSVQDYIDNLNNDLSLVDSKISDLEHFIEHNNLDVRGACRIIKEFKEVTLERRKIKNDMELARIFKEQQNKLISNNGNREMLMVELYKANSRLNKPYNNRVYTEEEMNYLIGKENKIDEN